MKDLKIFTDNIDSKAVEQIDLLLEQEAFCNSKIRIMPDVHTGNGCVIGFTGDLGEKVIPNVVGVDIGCGMFCANLGKVDIDFLKLDKLYKKDNNIDYDLAYLEGKNREEYLHDMKICQEFAVKNRLVIAKKIAKFMGWNIDDYFESVHNYISFKDNIVRKGAISARKGERVIIPINMRDGCILGTGKGNSDWNCSAPHGAGRIMSRKEALDKINLDEYKDSMKGIYSTSVVDSTRMKHHLFINQ